MSKFPILAYRACFIWLCAITGASLAACTQPASRSAALVIGQTQEPQTLNPLLLEGGVAEEIGTLAFSYLVAVDGAGRLVPDLALAVPTVANGGISEGGLHITYRLRKDARWQDGVALTARDVAFTYRAVMNPRNNVPTRLGFDQIASLGTPDPYTVVIRLKHPFAPFVTYFFEPENYPILPAHLLERYADLNTVPFNAMPVGSGPFAIAQWNRGDRLRLVANEHYYRGRPAMPELVLRFVANTETILNQLQTKEIDMAVDLDPGIVAGARDRLATTHAFTPTPIYGIVALLFNVRTPPLADRSVRRAIVQALDIETLVRKASRGTLSTAHAPLGLFVWAYDAQARPPPPNAAAASTVLAGRHLETTLAYDDTTLLQRIVAAGIQQRLREVGVTVYLKGFVSSQFHAPAQSGGPLASGSFGLALDEILTGYDPETSWLLRCDQAPPAGSNYARYCDPRVDRALRDAIATPDDRKRAADYRYIQQRVADDVPLLFLWRSTRLAITPKTLDGFAPSPETPYWDCYRWKWTQPA